MMLRLRQGQQIVVALLIAGVIVELVAVILVRLQPMTLDHGAHGTVQDQDALLEEAAQQMNAIDGHRQLKAQKTKTRPCRARSGFGSCPAL